jgi:FkbM family methyltransferase
VFFLKFVLVGILTGTVVASYLYTFENEKLYGMYRCWTGAPRWRLCYENEPFAFTTDLFGMRWEGHTRNYIDQHILYLGAYEKPILFFMRDVLLGISPNSGVFVDVGANTGQYSLFMSRHARQVHAFEPYEPVLQRFQRMIELNHINNIRVYPIGLGNKNEKVPFFEPPESNLGAGSFVADFGPDNQKYHELQILVGDEALAGIDSVDLIKIDVEGYEKLVLEGLAGVLKKARPVVVFELSIRPARATTFKSKEEVLQSFPDNYRFYLFDNNHTDAYSGAYRLAAMGEIPFDRDFLYDVVAYPVEKERMVPHKSSSEK